MLVPPGQGPASLGSNILLYQLIAGNPGRPLPPQIPPYYCHVRDASRAHLLALKLPKLPSGADVRDKRFLVTAPEPALWTDIVKYIAEKYMELKGRLPTLENAPPLLGLCWQHVTVSLVKQRRHFKLLSWVHISGMTLRNGMRLHVSPGKPGMFNRPCTAFPRQFVLTLRTWMQSGIVLHLLRKSETYLRHVMRI